MSKAKPVYPSERKVRKILITIPVDQISMIDNCAKAIGMSRSSFLQVYFDTYAEAVMNFAEGWLAGISYYVKKGEEAAIVEEAKATAETLTGKKMSVTRRRKTDE